MLDQSISIILTLGELLELLLDSGFSIFLIAMFVAMSYIFGKWIVDMMKKTLK